MVILCLSALSLLCWPSRPALLRLDGTVSSPWPVVGRLRRGAQESKRGCGRRPVWLLGALAVGAAAVPAGPAAAGAALLIAATVSQLTSSELRRRRGSRQMGRLLIATRTLAREVRTGSGPQAALLATAAAHPDCGAVFEQLAVAVGSRGSARTTDRRSRGGSGERLDQEAEVVARLGDGWQLSARYGVPWAALIDTVAIDLADRQRAASLRNAQVAGPRVSGYVLAVMPALGILLGAGMGADPVHVLLGTGVGSILLLVGSALTCLGLAWTAAIVRS